MKTYIVQKNINNRELVPFLEAAQATSVDLICFGELATTGLLYFSRKVDPLETLVKLLEPYDFAVMIGFPYDSPDGLRNAYLYCHRGKYLTYSKINLFAPMIEDKLFRPGSEPGLWKTDIGSVGVAICYDLRFPGIFNNLKRMGAERIFVPAAFPRVRINDWRRLLIERAVENAVQMIGINAVGDDGTNEFGGSSMVVAPDGRVIVEADQTSETVLEVQL